MSDRATPTEITKCAEKTVDDPGRKSRRRSRNRRRSKLRKGAADGPSIWDVATYTFKRYTDEEAGHSAYCVLCNRVLLFLAVGQIKPLESHFSTCRRQTYVPGDGTWFRCGPCSVKTRSFSHWRMFHVGSAQHKTLCAGHSAGRLYSSTCQHCDTVFYDTVESIDAHVRAHREQRSRTAATSDGLHQPHRQGRSRSSSAAASSSPSSYEYKVVPPLSAFMAYVYDMQDSPFGVYYCGVCNQWTNDRSLWWCCNEDKDPTLRDTFYCPSCKATFANCPQTAFRWHLSSAEHIALELAAEENGPKSQRTQGDPMNIVLRHFGRKSWHEAKVTCRSCKKTVQACDRPLLEHWQVCAGGGPHRDERDDDGGGDADEGVVTENYSKFCCGMCWETVTGPGPWSRHVLSLRHLTTCRQMHNYEYRECAECCALFYGTSVQIQEYHGSLDATRQHCLRRLAVADPMRYVFDQLNVTVDDVPVTFFYRQSTDVFGRCNRAADPATVPHYCPTCRLELYGDRTAYRQHAITVEHLLLRAFPVPSSSEPSSPAPTKQSPATLKLTPPTLKMPSSTSQPPSSTSKLPSTTLKLPSTMLKLPSSVLKPSPSPAKTVSVESMFKLYLASMKKSILKPSPSPLEPTPVSVTIPTTDEAFGRYVAARLQTVSDRDTKARIKMLIEGLLDLNSQ